MARPRRKKCPETVTINKEEAVTLLDALCYSGDPSEVEMLRKERPDYADVLQKLLSLSNDI